MKQRYINTKLWSDNWISNLVPIEKLLFIYLLTNERTNIAGIYELPIKYMSVETGIKEDTIKNILERFKKDKKVDYANGWIFICNFQKHQDLNNEKIKKGIEIIINSVPEDVRLSIGYPYPPNNTNTNTNTNSNTNNENFSKEINELINLFKIINPSYKLFFKNKTERAVLLRLLEEHGKEKVVELIEVLPKTNSMEYAPVITSPFQLEKKLGQLLAFIQKNKIKKNNIVII